MTKRKHFKRSLWPTPKKLRFDPRVTRFRRELELARFALSDWVGSNAERHLLAALQRFEMASWSHLEAVASENAQRRTAELAALCRELDNACRSGQENVPGALFDGWGPYAAVEAIQILFHCCKLRRSLDAGDTRARHLVALVLYAEMVEFHEVGRPRSALVERAKKHAEDVSEGGRRAQEKRLGEHAKWQAAAVGYFHRNPDASLREAAQFIARKFSANRETVRKHIKKPPI